MFKQVKYMHKIIKSDNKKRDKHKRKTPRKLCYWANCNPADSGYYFTFIYTLFLILKTRTNCSVTLKRKHTFSPAGQPIFWTEWVCLYWRDSIKTSTSDIPYQSRFYLNFINKVSDHIVFFEGVYSLLCLWNSSLMRLWVCKLFVWTMHTNPSHRSPQMLHQGILFILHPFIWFD